jgi:hypothetical protein
LSHHSHTETPARSLRWVPWVDALGIWLSAICIVHCALTPLVLLVLPLLGSHDFDLFARFGLATVGVVGVGIGTWLHNNKSALPLLVLALALFGTLGGFELVSGDHPPAALEFGVGLLASFALMGAHALNTRACRESDHDCPPGRWFADGLWPTARRGFDRGFWVALAFAGGLHAAAIGFAMQL